MNDTISQTRQIMGNVPAWLAVSFYLLAFAACVWTGLKFWLRCRRHRLGRHDDVATRPLTQRLLSVIRYLTFHRQLLEDRYAGVAHLLLFHGFFVLFVGTCLVFLEHDTPLHFFYGRFYLVSSLVIDLGGVAFVVGVLMFLYRRLSGQAERLLQRLDIAILLWLLLAIGLSGFALEGARIAVDRPDQEKWSVAGYAVAVAMNTVGIEANLALSVHRSIWMLHAILCIAFFVLLPWRFFSHIVFGPLSWASKSDSPRLTLRPVDLDLPLNGPGAGTWQQLSSLDLLQADACTMCGRCNSVCPAAAASKPLNPRDVVLGIRSALDVDGDLRSITDEVLWSCTTCGGCNEACPIGIDIYDKIVDLRRGRVEQGVVPQNAVDRFESSAAHFNPFQKPNDQRMDWAAGLNVPVAKIGQPVDLLFWVGCAGSFDPDGRSVSRAMIKILNHLGVNYAVLGKRERCTGDPARRMGEEGLFQELARDNLQTLVEQRIQKVVTHCPHCFNTMRNEYPQFGDVTFEVEHHSQFLARMIEQGRLKTAQAVDETITFHDPCYLGRGNGETAAPRNVLRALPETSLVEMERHGKQSFCCGGGGGSMWLDIKGETRIETIRAAEAAQTNATTVATGCPFCKVMLKAGQEGLGQPMQVKDLAELVVEAEGI